MSFHELPALTPVETRQSAAHGNTVARSLAPLVSDRDFRFPFAVVNVANREGLNSAAETAMEFARVPTTKRDAEAWVRELLKPQKQQR